MDLGVKVLIGIGVGVAVLWAVSCAIFANAGNTACF